MKVFGLIGFPLTHSFSKKYFTEKFRKESIPDCIYQNFPLQTIDEFPSLIKSDQNLRGLNVTIPYKELVLNFLDELDDTAAKIGAVNTIKFSDEKLIGFNTDVTGFMNSLIKELQTFHNRALILGTGGSSKAVAFALKKMGIEYLFVSRNPEYDLELSYDKVDRDIIREYKVIINTTPVGMFPDIDSCPPISYEYLTSSHLLFDLVYNPEETLFLKKGAEQGARTKNGLEMLEIQAEQSWQIWNS